MRLNTNNFIVINHRCIHTFFSPKPLHDLLDKYSNYMVRATKTLVFTDIGKADPVFVAEKCLGSS